MSSDASFEPALLIQELIERGVQPAKARRIVKHYSARGVRRHIEYYDYELRTHTRPDPDWLVERIKQDWRAPEGYPPSRS